MLESQSFITSVVVGKDIVPRIGLHQLEILRHQLQQTLHQTKQAKVLQILVSNIWNSCKLHFLLVLISQEQMHTKIIFHCSGSPSAPASPAVIRTLILTPVNLQTSRSPSPSQLSTSLSILQVESSTSWDSGDAAARPGARSQLIKESGLTTKTSTRSSSPRECCRITCLTMF